MIQEPDVLDEIGQLYMTELDKLALSELYRMIKQVTAAKDTAVLYLGALQSALHSRLGNQAQQHRQEAGKSTGTVRFEVDGYLVIADLPKRPEYDQMKLKEAVEALRKWGEDPENRAMGSGERVIHTAERPAFLAKNRYGLPETLPLAWDAFAQAMPDSVKPMLITPAATLTTNN